MRRYVIAAAVLAAIFTASLPAEAQPACSVGLVLNPGTSCIVSDDPVLGAPRLDVGKIQDRTVAARLDHGCLSHNRTSTDFAGARVVNALDPHAGRAVCAYPGGSILVGEVPGYWLLVCAEAEGNNWRVTERNPSGASCP